MEKKTLSPTPTAQYAIKRQAEQEAANRDLLDALPVWLDSPAIAYASWLAGQGYAESTQTVYVAMFSRFCQWLGESGKRLDQCDKEDIRLFLDAANPNLPESRQKAQASRQRRQYVIQLERVFAHLGSLGLGGTNPGRQAGYEKIARGADKPTRFLTREERDRVIAGVREALESLIEVGAGVEEWLTYRDLALTGTILGGGLKVSHLDRLTLNCMDMEEGRIDLSLEGYTHRARLLSFALEPIAAWLSIHRQLHGGELAPSHPVFRADRSSGFGRTAKTVTLHASSIHRRTQRFLESVGVTGDRASPQTLRNTYAALLIDGGVSDEELVDFMGLKASLTAQRLRQAYARSKAA